MATILDILDLLQAQEIPVKTVRKNADQASIIFDDIADGDQRAAAQVILDNNPLTDPVDQEVKSVLEKENITNYDLIMALWDQVVEGDSTQTDKIKNSLDAIKSTPAD